MRVRTLHIFRLNKVFAAARSKSPSATNYSFSCGCERESEWARCKHLAENFPPSMRYSSSARMHLSLMRRGESHIKIVINF